VFPYFSEKYSTRGTPTYLILDRGKIMGSILGITPYYDLIEKVNGILLGHECHTKTAGADHLHYENDPPDTMEEKNKDKAMSCTRYSPSDPCNSTNTYQGGKNNV